MHGSDDREADSAFARRRRGQVVGVISIGDVVKASLDAKDFVIKQLGNYITGDR